MQEFVEKTINSSKISLMQWRAIAIVTITLVLEGFDVQLVAFSAPSLAREWGINASALSVPLAAAMIGMIFGGVIGGALGDRLGRRLTLSLSVAIFGFLTMLTWWADNVTHLSVLRFIAGIGFGAAYPNATVLVAEWTPLRARAKIVSVLAVGVPLGGLVGAAISSVLIPAVGWRATFLIVGTLPLILALIIYAGLPESPAFLARGRRPHDHEDLRRLLSRLVPMHVGEDEQSAIRVDEVPGPAQESIFARRNLRVTLGLWLAFFGNLTVGYLCMSWTPYMLNTLGFEQQAAIRGSIYLNFAGLLGLVMSSWFYGRLGSRRGIFAMIVPAAIAVAGAGFWILLVNGGNGDKIPVLVLTATCFAFWGISGCQSALWSLTVHAYAPAMRTTGFGWSNSVGRLGGISSIFIGSQLLAIQPAPSYFLLFIALAICFIGLGNVVVNRHASPIK